jgi:coproporphyrinogen III oxidase-like Fe-S oxidoreductase
MFNLPDQTMDDVRGDMEIVDREIRPTYLDCYNLNVMPNTMFNDALQRESDFAEAPTDAGELKMMRELMRLTKELGYRQVMSNIFSKNKESCVLTLGMQLDASEAVGIGPSARGYLQRRGYRNVPDIDDYIERVNRDGFSVVAGNVATPDEEQERKLVMLGNFTFVKKSEVRGIEKFQPQIDFLLREGYAFDDGEYLRLTEEGKVWPGNVSDLFFNAHQRARRTRSMLHAFRSKENPYNQDHMGVSAARYRKPPPNEPQQVVKLAGPK